MTSLDIVNRALDSMKKFKSKIYKLTDCDIRKIKKDLEILLLIKKNYKVHLEIVVDKMSDDMIKIDHYLSNKVGDNL